MGVPFDATDLAAPTASDAIRTAAAKEIAMRKAALAAIQAAAGKAQAPVQAPVIPDMPVLDSAPGGAPQGVGMVFLRRCGEHRYWLVRFVGMLGLPANELPVNCDCAATAGACFDALQASYGAKLAGAWLLVAP